ncbi:flagellin [uncultured Hoeflea sp.]|uniref:flagellin N-terminal helical domain-containing protein n=1 Tax=uncultured Hoeflea sp. TaxID=538666 RepID=UPI0030D80014
MTSIHTNTGATAALQTLRGINNSMQTTQSRVATGYRVETAADNAAYWSIATTMRSDNKALSAVEDALALGAAKVDVAFSAMEASVDILDEIKARFVTAREPGVDRGKVQKEFNEFKNQLISIAQSASFSGENWLYLATPDDAANNSSDKELVGGFTRNSDGLISVQTIKLDFRDETQVAEPSDTWAMFDFMTGHIGDLGIATSPNFAWDAGFSTGWVLFKSPSPAVAGYPSVTEIALTSSTTDAELDEMIVTIDAMLQYAIEKASNYGTVKWRIDMQSEFAQNLSHTIDIGVGRLVDADMNEESTRLKALETQMQLGIQSLSIANANAQTLLSLFN